MNQSKGQIGKVIERVYFVKALGLLHTTTRNGGTKSKRKYARRAEQIKRCSAHSSTSAAQQYSSHEAFAKGLASYHQRLC